MFFFLLAGEELDKAKAQLESITISPLTERVSTPTVPSSPVPTPAASSLATSRATTPHSTGATRPLSSPKPGSTIPPQQRSLGGDEEKKPDEPEGPVIQFPPYVPPEGVGDGTGRQDDPGTPGNGGAGRVEGPKPPGSPGAPGSPGGPFTGEGPAPPAPRPPASGGSPNNGVQTSSTTTESPGVAPIEVQPQPNGSYTPEGPPAGHDPAPPSVPSGTEPEYHPPLPPTQVTSRPLNVPSSPFTPMKRSSSSVGSTSPRTVGNPGQSTSTLAPVSVATEVDDAIVKSIEDRQDSLRSILIWLILILFAVGIVLIVGAFAIYKGWCCKYDLQAKYESSFCCGRCCKLDASSRRNSPQEIIHMSELQRRDSPASPDEEQQSDADVTEDEREMSEDDSDNRSRSNRRRNRGTRSRRNQNHTAGEVTRIFIIPQGFEPPPTYEESIRADSNSTENQAQMESPEHGSSSVVVTNDEPVPADVNSSVSVVPVATTLAPVQPSSASPLNTLPSYEDSMASSGITISPEQLSQLTHGGSIPARARVFMLRSENRAQTLSVPRYSNRPGIPSNLVGREYITVARATAEPPRRDRRSPHRNRRNAEGDQRTGDRSNRSTPRSVRARSNVESPRRTNRNPTSRSGAAPEPPSGVSPAGVHRQNIRNRDSDSSSDTDVPVGYTRPPRYTAQSGTAPSGAQGRTLVSVVDPTSDATNSQESFTPSVPLDTRQVQVVANNSTTLSSTPHANHANVIVVTSNQVSSANQARLETRDSSNSEGATPPQSSAATPGSQRQPLQANHNQNYQRGISSASEVSGQPRMSRASRESDTFSTDSLESVCGVTIVHFSPSATNMPPPANMTDSTAVPSHRRLPSSQSTSSGLSANQDAPRSSNERSSRSSSSSTSASANPLDRVQPVRNSISSTNSGENSSAELQGGAASGAGTGVASVEETQDASRRRQVQVSSPAYPPEGASATAAGLKPPPTGEWVTYAPDGSVILSPGSPPSQETPNRTIIPVDPDASSSDGVSLGSQSAGARQAERNSISGYSAQYDAITLSSVVYVTSDTASFSDNASIGS